MKTYTDIINQLIQANDDLTANKISVEQAKIIGQNTQVLINAAKLQLEIFKAQGIKTSIFFMEPVEETIKQIEEKQKEPLLIDNEE